jgi:hypothetical protein
MDDLNLYQVKAQIMEWISTLAELPIHLLILSGNQRLLRYLSIFGYLLCLRARPYVCNFLLIFLHLWGVKKCTNILHLYLVIHQKEKNSCWALC